MFKKTKQNTTLMRLKVFKWAENIANMLKGHTPCKEVNDYLCAAVFTV